MPRFDYGAVAPWLRRGRRRDSFAAIGGDDGLLIRADFELGVGGPPRLEARFEVGEGERRRLCLGYWRRST